MPASTMLCIRLLAVYVMRKKAGSLSHCCHVVSEYQLVQCMGRQVVQMFADKQYKTLVLYLTILSSSVLILLRGYLPDIISHRGH